MRCNVKPQCLTSSLTHTHKMTITVSAKVQNQATPYAPYGVATPSTQWLPSTLLPVRDATMFPHLTMMSAPCI